MVWLREHMCHITRDIACFTASCDKHRSRLYIPEIEAGVLSDVRICDFSTLHQAHRMAAVLVISYPVSLPILTRLESELAIWQSRDDAVSRARAITTGRQVKG